MYPRSLPGQVHPAAREAAQARWRVVRRWLWLATLPRVTALLGAVAVVAVAYGTGAEDQPSGLVVFGILVLAQVGAVLGFERDPRHQRSPAAWPAVSLFTGVLTGASAVVALLPVLAALPLVLADVGGFLVVLAVAAAVAVPSRVASTRVLLPACPELGGTELRLQLPARSDAGWQGTRTAVLLADDAVVVDAAGGTATAPTAAVELRHPWDAIAGVTVRASVEDEAPWVVLRSGRQLRTVPGPVVQLDLVDGRSAVLPVDRADLLAAVVRYRVWARTGRTPLDHGSAPTLGARPGGFPPEALPAPPATGTPVRAVPGPTVPASTGTGRPWAAWALGASGVLVLPALLVLAQHVVTAGVAPATGSSLPGDGPGRATVVALVGVAVCTAGWVLTRDRPRGWTSWAVAGGAGTAVLTWAGTRGLGPLDGALGTLVRWWPLPALLVALAGATLARAGAVRIGALHPGHAGSAVLLRLPLAAGGELAVERDRVVLSPAHPERRGGNVRQAVALSTLTLLQPGSVAEPARWPVPGGRVVEVPAGPALRLTGGGQQWLLGVPDPVGLAHVLGARAAGAAPAPPLLEPDPWRQAQVRATTTTTGTRWTSRASGSRPTQNTARRWVRLGAGITAFAATAAGVVAVAAASGRELAQASWLLLGLLLGLAALGWGLGIDRRLRPAEDNPLPQGSPPWGEQRPDHAPVPGWQPWVVGPGR